MNESSTTHTRTIEDADLRSATIQVLGQRGWDGLTLERVAEVAGRARSTLWRQGWTRETLVHALTGELAADYREAMYPVLTSGGTGRERLLSALEVLCGVLDRHLPLMLATDEAFHRDGEADQPPEYLQPIVQFVREGVADGSLGPTHDVVEVADLAFNTLVWPYVHLRGRHGWESARARSGLIELVMYGIAVPSPKEG
ncbi:MAG TPA: hypothetical protein VID47_18185 [Actinomycetota bacterium]|jgi:AcrR family transcriptional regulator